MTGTGDAPMRPTILRVVESRPPGVLSSISSASALMSAAWSSARLK